MRELACVVQYGCEGDRIKRADAEQERSHEAHERGCHAEANSRPDAGKHQC